MGVPMLADTAQPRFQYSEDKITEQSRLLPPCRCVPRSDCNRCFHRRLEIAGVLAFIRWAYRRPLGLAWRERDMKRIVICFDGTWNAVTDPTSVTNVVRVGQAVKRFGKDDVAQVVYYNAGVGSGGPLDRLLGGVFGVGLRSNVKRGLAFLTLNWEYGDEIYILGFSRGAYSARALAGVLTAIDGVPKAGAVPLPRGAVEYLPHEPRAAADEAVADSWQSWCIPSPKKSLSSNAWRSGTPWDPMAFRPGSVLVDWRADGHRGLADFTTTSSAGASRSRCKPLLSMRLAAPFRQPPGSAIRWSRPRARPSSRFGSRAPIRTSAADTARAACPISPCCG